MVEERPGARALGLWYVRSEFQAADITTKSFSNGDKFASAWELVGLHS